jgi:two-component sensor histidine kinase
VDVDGEELALPLNAAVPAALLATELMSNAMKHAYPDGTGGTIKVRITRSTAGFELSVTDRGVGVSSVTSGTRGSGLHIARALAKQVGGTLSMETRPGGGTEAKLRVEAG